MLCNAPRKASISNLLILASVVNKAWANKDRSTLADTCVAFLLPTCIEPEGSKVVLPTRNFHKLPHILTLYMGIRWSHDFGCQATLFSHVCSALERSRRLGTYNSSTTPGFQQSAFSTGTDIQLG